MVGPSNILRHHEVLLSLHPRGATLGSEGVWVVADIDPINLGVGPVRAGQAGSLRQGHGSKDDRDDGVHLSGSSGSLSVNDKHPTDSAFYIQIPEVLLLR